MNSLWICVFACAFLIESSLALKCYSCNSVSHPGCDDLSNKSLQPVECVPSQIGVALDKITGIIKETFSQSDAANLTPKFVCEKLILSNPNVSQKRTIVRQCNVKTAAGDVCELARQTNNNVEFCGACEKDGCNGALSTTLISLPLLAIGLIAVKVFA